MHWASVQIYVPPTLGATFAAPAVNKKLVSVENIVSRKVASIEYKLLLLKSATEFNFQNFQVVAKNHVNYFRTIYFLPRTLQLVEPRSISATAKVWPKFWAQTRSGLFINSFCAPRARGGGGLASPSCDHDDGGTETQEHQFVDGRSEKRRHPHNYYATEGPGSYKSAFR